MSTHDSKTKLGTTELNPGFRLSNGRFKVVRCLGTGGMGSVHLVEDSTLHRHVALKTIREDLYQNENFRKRIERECLLHARMGAHPHIVTLYDRIEDSGHVHLVMEYVEGSDLEAILSKSTPDFRVLTIKESLEIISQALDALARIHAHGIVHRDIKPSNILVSRDDSGAHWAKLMDFGIARLAEEDENSTALTREGTGGPGTPAYMAPEQIDSRTFGAISPATDIYAVGIVLYQMLSGKTPFQGSITEVLFGHVNAPVPPVSDKAGIEVPAPVAELLDRALRKRPQERFASAVAFRDEIHRVMNFITDARPQTTPGVPPKLPESANETLVASEAGAPHAQFQRGSTMLSTGGARYKRQGHARLIMAIAAVVLLAVGAAATYQIAFRGETNAEETDVADAGTGSESTAETTEPTDAIDGAGQDALEQFPTQSDPITTAQDSNQTMKPDGSNVSAMDALVQNRTAQDAPNVAVTPDQGSAASTLQANSQGSTQGQPLPGTDPVTQTPDTPVQVSTPASTGTAASQMGPSGSTSTSKPSTSSPTTKSPSTQKGPTAKDWVVIKKENKKVQ